MLREETQLFEPDLDHTSEGKWLTFCTSMYKIYSHFSMLEGWLFVWNYNERK
ncbi:hypothetical protein LSP03_15160 [Lysinibacillus sphaericus]|nr:hypothetical protein T479_11220 [Lysinibacillus varians]GEC81773.1 hypothetical protein LSP03_15160 [Lysinibacillus sphaericus]